MRIILLVLSLLAFFAGVGFLSAAKSQIHEIEAFMLFIVSATLVSAAAVVDTVLRAIARNDRMEEMLPRALPRDVPDYHERQAAHFRALAETTTTRRVKTRLLQEAEQHEQIARGEPVLTFTNE